MARGPDRVITGEINDEQLKRISDLTKQNPEFQEILHGPAGYKSPYRTIEQIAQDRKSGVIAPSAGVSYKGLFEEVIDDNQPKLNGPTEEVPVEKPKAVIETTKEGRPVIKVGTPVNTAEEPATKETKKTPLKAGKKVEKASKKTEEVAQLPSMGGVLDDALSVAVSPKETSEALVEKAQEKMDPTKKVEERIEKEKEKAQEKLLDNFIEVDNARFRSAAGRAPVDTAFKKKLVEGITSVTGKAPGRTTMELLDAGEGLAGSVISAAKNGKNLRLAGTAALLSVAGFAIGKGRDRMGNQPDGPMGPDEASNLRKSLMSDGQFCAKIKTVVLLLYNFN